MSRSDKKEDGAISMESVRHQLQSFERQIQEYLDNLEANIETYKFSLEKQGEGLTIDVALRATIHVKKSANK